VRDGTSVPRGGVVANLFGKVKPETFGLIKGQLERVGDASTEVRNEIEKKLSEILVADGYAAIPADSLAWWLVTISRGVTYESPEEVAARQERGKAAGVLPMSSGWMRTGASYEHEKKKLGRNP
jgi:hypothetical protein